MTGTARSSGSDAMSFWDHADALRMVMLRILALVAVAAAVMWAVVPRIMESVILAPLSPDFVTYRLMSRLAGLTGAVPDFATGSTDITVINVRLASQFFIHMTLSLWLAVAAVFPAIIYMLWRFVAPGLHPAERSGAGRAFMMGTAMFYLGLLTGYLLVFPLTLRFLAGYSLSDTIANTLSLDSYMDNFFTLTLAMGLLFELPAVAWMLGRGGLVERSMFGRYRRHAIVVLMVLAAIITPSGDPFTLMAVFLPVYMLWELSARLVPAAQRHPEAPAAIRTSNTYDYDTAR